MHALISSRQNTIFICRFQAMYAYCQLGTGQVQLQPLHPTYIAAQPMVPGQAVVTGPGVIAGQQMVGAQPIVACQPLIASQPVATSQQMASSQPMGAISVYYKGSSASGQDESNPAL